MARELLRDLVFALRGLRHDWSFTLVAVAALALGIGANTAVFSVVNAILNFPLPFDDPQEVVFVWGQNEKQGINQGGVSIDEFLDWREQSESFESLVLAAPQTFNIAGDLTPVRIAGTRVSAGFFTMTARSLHLGRPFLPSESEPGGPLVVILGHGFWQTRLGSDPDIVDKTLLLDGQRHTIVGVTPPDFFFPNPNTEIFAPLVLERGLFGREDRTSFTVARLRDGVTAENATVEMQHLTARLAEQYAATNEGWSARVETIRDNVLRGSGLGIALLYGSITFVLLIACANVANLLLARAATREREMALRLSLGAGRLRLVRQLLTESLALAAFGGALGLLLGAWGMKLIRTMLAQDPGIGFITPFMELDRSILLYSLGVTVATGVLFGLAPAFQASKPQLSNSLREGSQGVGSSRSKQRLRSVLITAEVAMALALLATSGALIRTFGHIYGAEPGFEVSHLVTLQYSLPERDYPEEADLHSFHQRAFEALRRIPGVQSATSLSRFPLTVFPGTRTAVAEIEGGDSADLPRAPDVLHEVVDPSYFETLQVPVVEGRGLLDSDREDTLPVAVLSRAMALRFWPDGGAVGNRLRLRIAAQGGQQSRESTWLTVVGIAADIQMEAHSVRYATPMVPTVFMPLAQHPQRTRSVLLRSEAEATQTVAAVRQAIREIDPLLPIQDPLTMEAVIARIDAQNAFFVRILSVLSAIALLLGGTGIYGMISYAVNNRIREIGIRMALGARPRDVVTMVVGQTALLTTIGLVVGLALSVAFIRLLASQLEGISASHGDGPITFIVVSLILLAVAQLASWLPARRATRVHPMAALREE